MPVSQIWWRICCRAGLRHLWPDTEQVYSPKEAQLLPLITALEAWKSSLVWLRPLESRRVTLSILS